MTHLHLAQMKEISQNKRMKKTDSGEDSEVVCESNL